LCKPSSRPEPRAAPRLRELSWLATDRFVEAARGKNVAELVKFMADKGL
jgi:hypothetical protein